ncbi:MAG: tryptophan 7-halogenase, partial [Sphingomonas sp.]
YKTGIRFEGWSRRAGFGSYFHPFATALDGHTQGDFFANAAARRGGADVVALPDRFYLPAWLAANRRAPIAPAHFPFEVSYGYHFDAHLVGAVLREYAVASGVVHLERRIESVALAENGDVRALIGEGGEEITGDLFVDCSGFRALIAQQALRVPFLSFGDNLFNDAAVVMPTPRDEAGISPSTAAVAMAAGWRWHIPLTSRTGNGYVYASRYLSADAAETELRTALGLLDSDTPARHLKMKVGRVERSWERNCLAVGLSQGFIEPLEATALHIVQASVEGFISAYQAGGFTAQHRGTFNTQIARRYDGIRDYIVGHYRLNQRGDTAYWRDNAGNQALSDSLKSLFTCWFTGGDMVAEVDRQKIGGYYAPLSWYCLFAGYGTFPDDARLQAVPDTGRMAAIDDFIGRCGGNFADHDVTLGALGR